MNRKVGFNTHLPRPQARDKIKAANIKWIRCDFNWNDIEQQPGIFNYGLIEEIVPFCKANDIHIFATIGYTPSWANGNQDPCYPPNDVEDWKNFVSKVVNCYKDEIKVWGIWNEPNFSEYFKGTMNDYVDRIFLPASRIIRTIDPNLKIAAPEIATIKYSNWGKWLDKFATLGNHYDILTVHCYGKNAQKTIDFIESGLWPLGIRWLSWLLNLIWPDRQAIKNKLNKIAKEAWLTETGWKTTSEREEEQQRQYYEEMVEYMNISNTFERLFFYDMVDDIHEDQKWGVLRCDYSEKPAYIYIKSIFQ